MSGSHNRSINVPGASLDVSGPSLDVPGPSFDVPRTSLDVRRLTADEIQARVLHRDGLMLVIDKPAGLPVHRGSKGGANLEASFDGLRFGLPRPPVLAHRLDKDTSGCLVLGTPSQGHRLDSACCSSTARSERPTGPWSRADLPRRRHHRHAARAAQRRARLVAEAGSGRARKPSPAGKWRPRRRPRLARAGTSDRPHPSIARTHVAMGWPIVGDNI